MQILNHHINFLSRHPTHPVLEFESTQAPDAVIIALTKRFPFSKFPKLKKIIIICQLSVSHKRLDHIEHLEVLFLLSNKNNKLILNQAVIQHPTQEEFTTFKDLESSFKNPTDNTFVLKFDNQLHQYNKHIISDFLELKPVHIPKPWGQEIWYSGIESRGISHLKNQDKIIPLSWVLSAFPNLIFGKKHAVKDPILLKILDPLAEPVTGDLYYEMHLEKNEVYIVTAISSESGRIKIGINSTKLKEYEHDIDKYKSDFFNSIQEYEKLRRKIDSLIDKQQDVAPELLQSEQILRENMDSFCGYKDLKVGDVISVPTKIPHALQHGVQVIEFQTPTYERLIISFAQKVLTQSHWNTKEAFEHIQIQPFEAKPLKTLSKSKTVLKELVCQFDEFKVIRWAVTKNTSFALSPSSNYRMLFIITGTCKINNKTVTPQTCVLIPQNQTLLFKTKEEIVFVLCEPNNKAPKDQG